MRKQTTAPAVLTAALLFFFTAADAQNSIGLRAGLNASNVSFDNLPGKKERLAFHVGVFGRLPVYHNFISLKPELSYSVKGASFEYLNEKRNLDLKYLDFMLPLAFRLGSVDIELGPFVSFLTSTPDYAVYNENRIETDAFKKVDAGITGGLVFNIDHFLIGIRYNQGLIDVTKDNSRPLLGSGKNAVGQLSLGYRF